LAAAIVCFAGEGMWLVILPWLRKWRERRQTGSAEEAEYA